MDESQHIALVPDATLDAKVDYKAEYVKNRVVEIMRFIWSQENHRFILSSVNGSSGIKSSVPQEEIKEVNISY